MAAVPDGVPRHQIYRKGARRAVLHTGRPARVQLSQTYDPIHRRRTLRALAQVRFIFSCWFNLLTFTVHLTRKGTSRRNRALYDCNMYNNKIYM